MDKKLDEKVFKSQFIASFLASWVAQNFTDSCMRGQHKKLEQPPVEDAEFLAQKAWEHWVKLCEK